MEDPRGAEPRLSERVVVLSAVAREEDALRIAGALVERGLAACVNVVPGVVSIYRWKGAVQREAELMLVIKTRSERLSALKEALTELHPYDVPEALVLPVSDGLAPYLAWLDDAVRR
jgi:periplasmic divalent cation tolerance protein